MKGPRRRRELARASYAGDVSVAIGIHSDAGAGITAPTTGEVRGVNEGRARGIELRCERTAGGAGWLERPWSRRKVRGAGGPCYVSVTGRVQGDRRAVIPVAAPEVGRVDEGRARGIELGHERVGKAAGEIGLKGARCGRKAGSDAASHVGVAGVIDRDPVARVKAAVAQQGGVDKSRTRSIELRHEDDAPSCGARLEGAGSRRERGGAPSETRHISLTVAIDGDRAPLVYPTKKRGVDELGACRIELRSEGALEAIIDRGARGLEGPWGCGEVAAGEGPARDVRVAAGIHGDRCARVIEMAAEIRGVDQRSSRRIEFRDEHVCGRQGIGAAGIETACPLGLKGTERRGKVS